MPLVFNGLTLLMKTARGEWDWQFNHNGRKVPKSREATEAAPRPQGGIPASLEPESQSG